MRHDGLELRGGEHAGVAEVFEFGAAGGEGAVDCCGVGHLWKMILELRKVLICENDCQEYRGLRIDVCENHQESRDLQHCVIHA